MNRGTAVIALFVTTMPVFASPAMADSFQGRFVDEIVFNVKTGLGDPPTTILGAPDGQAPDLNNSGGYTVRFARQETLFDYTEQVFIPDGTDLILAEATIYTNATFELKWGYASDLLDANVDGYADNVGGQAVLLGTSSIGAPPWMPWYGCRLWFFDLDQYPSVPFVGATDDFFVAVNDVPGGDSLDMDAMQVVPERALLVSAVSRRTHGSGPMVHDFDIDLPLDPPESAGIECRADGPTPVVLTFNEPMQATDGAMTPDQEVTTQVNGVPTVGLIASLSVAGSQLAVTLANVPDDVCLRLILAGIEGLAGNALAGDNDVHIGVLFGDVTGDGVVNIVDLVEVKKHLFTLVSESNFRCDVNRDGVINIEDLNQVKANLFAQAASCP